MLEIHHSGREPSNHDREFPVTVGNELPVGRPGHHTQQKQKREQGDEVTRGVTVGMSAVLACHQCYCAGSSLAWGLNLRAVVCDIF